MKTAFYLLITLCLLSACAKKDNLPATPANTLVGEWKWVDVYMYRDMHLTPKTKYDLGLITFTADGKLSRVKPDGTTENGSYMLGRSAKAGGVDSILYNQSPGSRTYYEALNNTFDFYIITGDTLKIGGINAYGVMDNYGLTQEYVRSCNGQILTAAK